MHTAWSDSLCAVLCKANSGRAHRSQVASVKMDLPEKRKENKFCGWAEGSGEGGGIDQ
ncbi:hypothetical protein STEG23_016356, partial [Scotinomys teguina]